MIKSNHTSIKSAIPQPLKHNPINIAYSIYTLYFVMGFGCFYNVVMGFCRYSMMVKKKAAFQMYGSLESQVLQKKLVNIYFTSQPCLPYGAPYSGYSPALQMLDSFPS